MKSDLSGWAEALAKEIRGDDVPPHAKTVKELAVIWGLSDKGADNEAMRRYRIGEFCMGRKKGPTGHKAKYFWPNESRKVSNAKR